MPTVDPGTEASLQTVAPYGSGILKPTTLWYALVSCKTLHPEWTAKECAKHCNCAHNTATGILRTTWARARLERALDIRPYLQDQLKRQALDALDATGNAVNRFNREIEKDEPQPSVLNAGMTAAIKTLEGVGLFKQQIQLTDARLAGKDDAQLLCELANDPDIAKALAKASTDTPPTP